MFSSASAKEMFFDAGCFRVGAWTDVATDGAFTAACDASSLSLCWCLRMRSPTRGRQQRIGTCGAQVFCKNIADEEINGHDLFSSFHLVAIACRRASMRKPISRLAMVRGGVNLTTLPLCRPYVEQPPHQELLRREIWRPYARTLREALGNVLNLQLPVSRANLCS